MALFLAGGVRKSAQRSNNALHPTPPARFALRYRQAVQAGVAGELCR